MPLSANMLSVGRFWKKMTSSSYWHHMLVRMNGHHMVALELATRLYKRRLHGDELRRLNYHRDRYIEWMKCSKAIDVHEDRYRVKPGTARIPFTLLRLIMILDTAKLAQQEKIVVDKTLDQAITILEKAHV